MKHLQDIFQAEWGDVITILNSVNVDLKKTTSIKEIQTKLNEISIVEDAIYDDYFQSFFKNEEEVKKYSKDNKKGMLVDLSENQVEYFMNNYTSDYEGYTYIENKNFQYDRQELSGSQVKQINEFKLFIDVLLKKEELNKALHKNLQKSVNSNSNSNKLKL